MGLIKMAEGLQKFTMTCGFWRSLKWTGLSLSAIGLQVTAISYCYEHTTDGKLPKDPEDLAAVLGLKLSQVKGAMRELIGRGIWIVEDGVIEIDKYLENNPSRIEIKAHREGRRLSSLKANHTRWHKDGVSDSECPFCSDTQSDSVSDSDNSSEWPAESNVEESRGEYVDVPDLDTSSTSSSTGVDNGDADAVQFFIRKLSNANHDPDDIRLVAQKFENRLHLGRPITDPIAWARPILDEMRRRRNRSDGTPKHMEVDGEQFTFVEGRGWTADDELEVAR